MNGQISATDKEAIFQEELTHLLNKYSKENGSNTADFVLAQYLVHCLEAFDYAVRYRNDTKPYTDLGDLKTPKG